MFKDLNVDRVQEVIISRVRQSIAFTRGAIGFPEFDLLLDFVVIEFAVGLDALNCLKCFFARFGGEELYEIGEDVGGAIGLEFA